MTSPLRAGPEPCFHCGATQTYYGIDTMQQCNVCGLFCCELCGEVDCCKVDGWTGDVWQQQVTCKECPSWRLKQLERERSGTQRKWVELAAQPEAASDSTLGLRQGPRGY